MTKELSEMVQLSIIDNTTVNDPILKQIGFSKTINQKSNYITPKDDSIILTEHSIKTICDKYNLYRAALNKFIGKIPKINIEAIKTYYKKYPTLGRFYEIDNDYKWTNIEFKDLNFKPAFKFVPFILNNYNGFDFTNDDTLYSYGVYTLNGIKKKGKITYCTEKKRERERKFIIIATLDQFDLKDSEIKNREIISNDPIILEKIDDYYRVVTSWNKESGIIEIQNKKYN